MIVLMIWLMLSLLVCPKVIRVSGSFLFSNLIQLVLELTMFLCFEVKIFPIRKWCFFLSYFFKEVFLTSFLVNPPLSSSSCKKIRFRANSSNNNSRGFIFWIYSDSSSFCRGEKKPLEVVLKWRHALSSGRGRGFCDGSNY